MKFGVPLSIILKGKNMSYESEIEKKYHVFKEQAKKDGFLEDFKDVCDKIQAEIEEQKKSDFEDNKEEIKSILKTDLVSRYYFSKGVIITNLHQDRAIARSMELLNIIEDYHAILK